MSGTITLYDLILLVVGSLATFGAFVFFHYIPKWCCRILQRKGVNIKETNFYKAFIEVPRKRRPKYYAFMNIISLLGLCLFPVTLAGWLNYISDFDDLDKVEGLVNQVKKVDVRRGCNLRFFIEKPNGEEVTISQKICSRYDKYKVVEGKESVFYLDWDMHLLGYTPNIVQIEIEGEIIMAYEDRKAWLERDYILNTPYPTLFSLLMMVVPWIFIYRKFWYRL